MDPKVKAEFSVKTGEKSEMSANANTTVQTDKVDGKNNSITEEKALPFSTLASSGSSLIQGEDTVSKREDLVVKRPSNETDKGRKSSAHSNYHSGKKKVKVEWTPELHRQFVQAVEQLGVDKAVPSKILELMGTDCLNRHNVASHLQKYRYHRKHMLAREAEAATWSRRNQICRTTGRTVKGDMNSWTVRTTGFPSVTSMPHIRPLHVWGHPSADQSLAYMWPGHVASSPSPPAWVPPGDPYFWYCHRQDVPALGMPCCPPYFLPTRFTTFQVSGLPPTSMYRVSPSIGLPIQPNGPTLPQPSFDSYPSKEKIDAVIGEVLSRPWLPLPLGLKPPAIDSVMMELQRQGISKVPPTCV